MKRRMKTKLAAYGAITAIAVMLGGCPSPFAIAELVGVSTGVDVPPDGPYNVRINNYSHEVIVLATEMELIDSYNTIVQPEGGDGLQSDELGRLLIERGDAKSIVFTITGQTSGRVVEIIVPATSFVTTDNVPTVWDSSVTFINNYNRDFAGAP